MTAGEVASSSVVDFADEVLSTVVNTVSEFIDFC
jgi:hypothetical protein